MERRRLGQSGLWVSRLGLGTMTWGQDTDAHEAADILKVYLDAGGSLVDTAAAYGEGESESILGALLRDVVDRDEVVVATKGGIVRQDGVRRVDTSRGALLDQLDRVPAAARHRPRGPVAGAHLVVRTPRSRRR